MNLYIKYNSSIWLTALQVNFATLSYSVAVIRIIIETPDVTRYTYGVSKTIYVV